MIPVLTAAQAAAWDAAARTAHGIPGRVLMDAAGRAVAQVVADTFGAALSQGVLLAAGPGNNGGDGWVAARALRAMGLRVLAVEAGERRSPDGEANRALALAAGVESVAPDGQWPAVGVVLDALLGTGATGALRGGIATLAQRVAAFGAPVAAIDGPTGLDLSTGYAWDPIRARVTVTFGGVRRGHLVGRDWCGRIVVVDIGFPSIENDWPMLVDDRWAHDTLPPFHSAMHKGDRGKVLVVGGDEGMAGAAIHAARAALVAGAGMVKLAASDATLQAANETLPDALTVRTTLGSSEDRELADAVAWADAVVVGPGLGRSKERGRLVRGLLKTAKPAVIDADALHAGADSWGTKDGLRVLTPHPGEFAAAFPHLADLSREDRFAAAERAAVESGATVLLKGVPTVVATGGTRSLVIAAGTPALATGGSGDVLSGFIGAFLARGLGAQRAAGLAAHAMGRAAERAAVINSARAARPADVLASAPDVWKHWAEVARPRLPILAELDPPILE
ncbi:MAG: NAD(P)H-hydrate dehydratase [Gemmatimonadetes bacterium]|nr:NAD(P)H-hydrate dehydratase [Gemmatimonadota bacterium]